MADRGSRVVRKNINLAVIEVLMHFARQNLFIHRAHMTVLAHAFQEEFDILIGTADPTTDGDQFLSPYLNQLEWKYAFMRFWATASLYLRVTGLVVIAVTKDLTEWIRKIGIDKMAKQRTAEMLPFSVVNVTKDCGVLSHVTDAPLGSQGYFMFEPARQEDKSTYDYIVYTDPLNPSVTPLLLEQMEDGSIDIQMARLISQYVPQSIDGMWRPPGVAFVGTVSWTRDQPDPIHLLGSPFFRLRARAMEISELRGNSLNVSHALSFPPIYYHKLPISEAAPQYLSDVLMPRLESLAETGQNESMRLLQRSFLFGAYTAANYLTPNDGLQLKTAADGSGSGTRRRTVAGIRGEYYGRAQPRENFLMLPDIVKSVMYQPPSQPIDPMEWQQHFLAEIAMVFDIPLAYLDGGATETKKGSLSGGASSGECDITMDHMKRTVKVERQRIRAGWMTLYQRIMAVIDMLALSSILEKLNQNERVVLTRVLAQRGFAAPAWSRRLALTAPQLRGEAVRILSALPGPSLVTITTGETESEVEEIEEEDDDAVASNASVRRLRLLLGERLVARSFLPSTIRFGADVIAAAEKQNEHPVDLLGAGQLEGRLKVFEAVTKATAAGFIKPDSAVKAMNDLLPLGLKAAPLPPPTLAGGEKK